MILPHLFIAPSVEKKGKGVFTSKSIKANTVIEISPVLVFTVKEGREIEKTTLYHYVFEWGDSRRLTALGLGYISMYNHDYSANCEYEMDFDNNLITIRTVKAIKKGGELYINYNATPDDKKPLWFDAK
jgi:SET domain-containing protein